MAPAIRSVAVLVLVAACQPPEPRTVLQPSTLDAVAAAALVGRWQWSYALEEHGLRRTERERWELVPTGDGHSVGVRGAYLREVEVVSTNGVPFQCNQDLRYTQRARFEVRAVSVDGTVLLEEIGYRTEPSPCDRGFRRLGYYRAIARDNELALRWDGGAQILHRAAASDEPSPLSPPSWPGDAPAWSGAWQWAARTIDDAGHVRDEREAWDLAVGTVAASATYVRTVTVHSQDGAILACAGAPSWSYVDRYLLEGRRDGDEVFLREVAAAPGLHPCLPSAPRTRDTASAHLDGSFVELIWRGKRRQVLHR